MIIGDLLALGIVLWISIHAILGIRKLGFVEYSIGRGFGLWSWFIVRGIILIILSGHLAQKVDWGFLNYKIW